MTIFRFRLKEILTEKQWTQQKLSTLTGLRPTTISCLCKENVSRTNISTLGILCDALDVTLNDLLIEETKNRR